MSVIYLKNHEENIYSITTKPVPLVKKSPRYRSKYADYVRKPNVYSTICKESHKSMGKPVECLPNPKDFLRKGTGKQPHSRCRPYVDPKIEFQKKDKVYPTKEEVIKNILLFFPSEFHLEITIFDIQIELITHSF